MGVMEDSADMEDLASLAAMVDSALAFHLASLVSKSSDKLLTLSPLKPLMPSPLRPLTHNRPSPLKLPTLNLRNLLNPPTLSPLNPPTPRQLCQLTTSSLPGTLSLCSNTMSLVSQ